MVHIALEGVVYGPYCTGVVYGPYCTGVCGIWYILHWWVWCILHIALVCVVYGTYCTGGCGI